jgi:hypothetical protein
VGRGDGWDSSQSREREGKVIDVVVDDVELVRALVHVTQLEHGVGHAVPYLGIETQAPRATGLQVRIGRRIATGEQRHVMAAAHKLLGQHGDDALGASPKGCVAHPQVHQVRLRRRQNIGCDTTLRVYGRDEASAHRASSRHRGQIARWRRAMSNSAGGRTVASRCT